MKFTKSSKVLIKIGYCFYTIVDFPRFHLPFNSVIPPYTLYSTMWFCKFQLPLLLEAIGAKMIRKSHMPAKEDTVAITFC